MFAHRLDPDSGGVLLLAKNKDVLTKLSDFFGSERHALSFITLVSGAPAETQFTIEAKIAPNPTQPGLMQVSRKFGKRARTMFEIVERFSNWTLLRCAPLTYRLHQIRVHLARAGLRVVGDELYGGKPLWLSDLKPKYHLKPGHTEKPLLNRVCLYAERLDLVHPITNAPLTIDAPWPKDLLVALKYLRKFAPAATS
jgi:23S rRNA-/tRNA-specific pseudouridylate synthase